MLICSLLSFPLLLLKGESETNYFLCFAGHFLSPKFPLISEISSFSNSHMFLRNWPNVSVLETKAWHGLYGIPSSYIDLVETSRVIARAAGLLFASAFGLSINTQEYVGVIQRLSLTGGSVILSKGPIPQGSLDDMGLVVGNAGAAEDQLTLTVLDATGKTVVVVTENVQTADCDHVMFVIPKGGVENHHGTGLPIETERWDHVWVEICRGRIPKGRGDI